MSQAANAKDIDIGENAGKVASDNTYDVKGIGPNASLGNTTDILVGKNAEKGRIGAKNSYKIEGGLGGKASVGNTAHVAVGQNSGSIGSGNRVNIS